MFDVLLAPRASYLLLLTSIVKEMMAPPRRRRRPPERKDSSTATKNLVRRLVSVSKARPDFDQVFDQSANSS